MKVLVTGAAGFLGSWLATRLLDQGHEVVAYDNLSGGYLDNVDKRIECPWQTYVSGYNNILDLSMITAACARCDAVIHCAALAYEGLSVFSPSAVANNIVGGTVNVAVAAIRAGVKRFVNCSSMARYGKGTPPFSEYEGCGPVDPYGMAKVAAERQLNLLGEVHGMTVVHAVPHNIYGPRQRYDDPYRNVAAIFTNLMLQGRQPVIYGKGDQTRCFSYIDDVLDVMLQLLTTRSINHGEVFNVGPDKGEVTILELAETLADIIGFNAVGQAFRPTFMPDRPCEVKHAFCSSEKIRRRFGFEQKVSLRDGLEQLVGYIRERGPAPFRYLIEPEIVSPLTPRTWTERMF